ncbi:MAG: hypothetical protein PHD63_02745, partial [Candidatus Marinimicrobia bacterium]|nr:hypothetical protein [Candidatus Neomarinimicrobiota bacterium]
TLMRFFAAFIEIKDYESARSTLLDFKQKIKEQGDIQVFDLCEENYDFLYNSLTERANNEKKGRPL